MLVNCYSLFTILFPYALLKRQQALLAAEIASLAGRALVIHSIKILHHTQQESQSHRLWILYPQHQIR